MSSVSSKPNTLSIIAQVFLVVAIGLSGYLTFQALTSSPVLGCGAKGGCNQVLSSQWSHLFTIPISIFGLFIYTTLLINIQLSSFKNGKGAFFAVTLSLCILFSAFWFIALQAFTIHSYCLFCCLTHLSASLAAILTLFITFRHRREQSSFFSAAIAALALIGITVAAQTFGPQKESSEALSLDNTDKAVLIAPYRAHSSAPLKLSYTGGSHYMPDGALQEITLGNQVSGKEPVFLAYLFDWTCDHCRVLHNRLHELSKEETPLGLEDYYIISLLPGAYDSEGKTLHRIMLAAQQNDLATYTALESGLHDGSLMPDYNVLNTEASSLLGAEEWARMLKKDPHQITQALDIAVAQAAYNSDKLGASVFPQLLSIHSLISGVPSNKALKAFLINAAKEQKSYLENLQKKESLPILFSKENPASDKTKAFQASETKRNNAKIEFDSRKVITAPIQAGETATGTFHFKNTGTEQLEIYKINTGCGCTTAQNWKQTIAPGEKGTFTVQYNSKGKMPYGPHNRTIWVNSSASNFENPSFGNKIQLSVPIVDEYGNEVTIENLYQ